ncbi:MAG: rhodanese-like domain-containing protein [Acidobacteria bacterium]|nr:rhodanese-like domain-containing protein [Acidobacteriota bacterium]MCI0625964.1 rhodanese-like domain-containing protein [Acidobacteriota bacterium]MCI0721424.1 rhodanese-like domain-containing protein [Acidobacteriota bacterium]
MDRLSVAGCSRMLLVDAGIVLLSAWIGVSLNRAFVAGPQQSFFTYSNTAGKGEFRPLNASEATSVEAPGEVQLRDVREIIASKSMVLLDGRSETDYENGHLPGAYSLSVTNFEKRFLEFSAQYPKQGAFVIYCGSGECGLSRRLASLLQQQGYRQLKIYSAGYNDWFLSGNAVEKGKGSSLK